MASYKEEFGPVEIKCRVEGCPKTITSYIAREGAEPSGSCSEHRVPPGEVWIPCPVVRG